ncbi:hypothetical protein [Aquimarina sp. SS2-1]|uniref:hypothetical protein n=1 Tax=Aquimarina besae TaxID=3342247 RepID=UPI00366AEA7F
MKRNITIGILLVAVGILMQYAFEADFSDFLSGIAVGAGIGVIITTVFVKRREH